MASFSEEALIKKLAELNASQQSIQTLSLWLIHHRKHHQTIVKVWYKEVIKAVVKRKITFVYLANDVIQNSKKKGPEYGKEFGEVLGKVFGHLADLDALDNKSRGSLERVLKIWEERGVYNSQQIIDFKKALGIKTETPPRKKRAAEPVEELPKKSKKEKEFTGNERRKSETEVEVDGIKEVHVTLSPKTPAIDPPDPEEIMKALLDLENAASCDVAVREAIAELPNDVADVDKIKEITDRISAERLFKESCAAIILLTDYNARLAAELDDRKKVTAMLKEFTLSQAELLAHAKERLEEYQDKLQKVHQVRQEVRSHIQNLPDITQLPDVTGGLAPLPSAGDLFSFHS